MAGQAVYRKTGPDTYSPVSGATVLGGQLVEAAAGGRIQKCGAGSVKVLGVALTDAIAPEQVATGTTTDALGRPVLAAVAVPSSTAVAYDVICKVTYAANANFGDLLISAANGTVTPAGATPDARTIVGRCVEPAGVVVGTNPKGLARIFR